MEEFLDQIAKQLLEKDDFYNKKATPLKSAGQLKNEHLIKIREQLKLDEVNKQLTNAIIRIKEEIPKRVDALQWAEIQKEFLKAEERAKKWKGKNREAITFKQLMGFSDRTLQTIDDLAYQELKSGNCESSESLFFLLTFLNPTKERNWFGHVISLFNQGKYRSAKEILELINHLFPHQTVQKIYLSLCRFHLEEVKDKRQEISELYQVVIRNPHDAHRFQIFLDQIRRVYGT